MWAAAADPYVLRARASPAIGPPRSAIDLSSFAHCFWKRGSCAHVRVGLPDGMFRLDLIDGTIGAGIVELEPAIDLSRDVNCQIASLRRLVALRKGELPPSRDQSFVRLVEALRASDALAAGASLREIGIAVFGADDWPGDSDHVKSRVRRRIELATRLMRAGPIGVLARKI